MLYIQVSSKIFFILKNLFTACKLIFLFLEMQKNCSSKSPINKKMLSQNIDENNSNNCNINLNMNKINCKNMNKMNNINNLKCINVNEVENEDNDNDINISQTESYGEKEYALCLKNALKDAINENEKVR